MKDFFEYLGCGLKYPFSKGANGDLAKSKYLESVASSVMRIIDTPLGSMPMRRNMGTQLIRLVFETSEAIIQEAARVWIKEALLLNEPRIDLVDTYVYFLEENAVDAITKYTARAGRAAIINTAYMVKRYQVPQVVRVPLQQGVF